MLRHGRLPRGRRRGHQHRLPAVHAREGGALEPVVRDAGIRTWARQPKAGDTGVVTHLAIITAAQLCLAGTPWTHAEVQLSQIWPLLDGVNLQGSRQIS